MFDEDPVRDWLTLAIAYNWRTLAPYRDTELWDKVDPLLAAQVDWAAEHLSAARRRARPGRLSHA